MQSNYKTINIEKGLPRVEAAMRLLADEIGAAKRTGIKVIKVIHGYGSTGKGGALKKGLREMLFDMKDILAINGEVFSIFDENTRKLLFRFPQMRKDRDLDKSNPGITIIMLK